MSVCEKPSADFPHQPLTFQSPRGPGQPPLLDSSADHGSQRSFYLMLLSYPKLPPASFHRPLQHLLTQQLLPVLRPALGASGAQCVGSCNQSNLCSSILTPPHKRLPSVGSTAEKYNLLLFQADQLGVIKIQQGL